MQQPRTALFASLLCFGLAAGCVARPKPRAAGPDAPWVGDTEPMEAVVAAINRNNASLRTLWEKHYYEVNVFEEQQPKHFVNGNGALLYRQPQGMLLRGNKEGIGQAFEVGSTDEHYWLTMKPGPAEPRQMWWGAHENIGKPCAEGLRDVPIRPDMILAVLGVGVIDTDFLTEPAPVMRFNNDAHAYMFVWSAPRPDLGKRVAVKEIWYDRETYRPVRVFLHDEDGRVVLRARLSNHQPVPTKGEAEESWPVIATDYRLYFPDSGTTMSFELSGLAPDKDGVPSKRGIAFDPRTAPKRAQEVVQIDEGCAD